MNYIEQLLAKIEDAEARQEFSGLLEKVPTAKDWIVDPETRTRNEQLSQWAETQWDYDHNMSRLEYQQQQELADLQAQMALRAEDKGQGMELNELNEHLGKYIKDNGLMTKAEYEAGIAEKSKAFENELNVVSTLATRVSYLNGKYSKDFGGEMFDPDEFITKANEKGYAQYGKQGLDKFYDEFTAEKRATKQAADLEAMKAAAREEGRQEALKQRGMGEGGNMPTLDGSPEMGHFEAKLKGGHKPLDPAASQVPVEVELGRGVGRMAAAIADAKDRQSVQ